jgi:hypothetical protein
MLMEATLGFVDLSFNFLEYLKVFTDARRNERMKGPQPEKSHWSPVFLSSVGGDLKIAIFQCRISDISL